MELILVIHSQIQISVKLLAPLLIIILVCYYISYCLQLRRTHLLEKYLEILSIVLTSLESL